MKNHNFDGDYFEKWYAPFLSEKQPFVELYLRLIEERKQNIKRVLDLGCGFGDFLKAAQGKNWETFGVEISKHAIEVAKKETSAKLHQVDLNSGRLPYPDNFFDVVTAFDIVEHLKSPDLLFSEVKRVLKKKGLFFFTTPNGGVIFHSILAKIVPDDPTHINVQDENYWRKQLTQVGFSQIELKGLMLSGFPPTKPFRDIFRSLKLPVILRPVFSPFKFLNSSLYLFSFK